MTIERIELKQHDQRHNREVLARSVVGVPCVNAYSLDEALEAGNITNNQLQVMVSLQKPFEKLGTVEVYANGAVNVFVRKYENPSMETGHQVVAVFLIR